MKQKLNGKKPEFSDYQLSTIISSMSENYIRLNAKLTELKSKGKAISLTEANLIGTIEMQLEATAELKHVAEQLRDFEF